MFYRKLLLAKGWFRVYEGEETVAGGNGNDTLAGGGGNDTTTAGGGGTGNDDTPKFSQKQLNKFLADDRRKHEDRVNKTVEQLETLKKGKQLSDQQRTELQNQIDDMKNSLLTKEEQAKMENEKRDKEYKSSLQTVSTEKDFWQNQYAGETTRNKILIAAHSNEAVSEEQLMDFLIPKTRLVEVVGEDGKGTKQFVPKVKFKTKNDKAEEIELDLTIEEAVKRMKDEPERFGNLFKSGLSGGLGAGGSAGGGSLTGDKPPTDPVAYRAWRKQKGLTSRK